MEREAHGLQLQIGDKAPYFSLKGTDNRIHTISDFVESPLLVVFTCNHCPYAQAYEGRLCQIGQHYGELGVKIVAINANDSVSYPEDDFAHMVEKSKTLELPFPYLHDDTQAVARAYDAACTPECYLFDKEHRLIYHGRIDDNHRDPAQVERRELQDALDAMLKGNRPPAQLTPAIGCSIKWRK